MRLILQINEFKYEAAELIVNTYKNESKCIMDNYPDRIYNEILIN